MSDRRNVLTNGGDYSHVPSTLRVLFEAWQNIEDECHRLDIEHPELVVRVEAANFERQAEAGERIAAFPIQTLQEAACLLSCVYLDEDTEGAWGLAGPEQKAILESVKAFLRSKVATESGEHSVGA
jgi:hypothetical protein